MRFLNRATLFSLFVVILLLSACSQDTDKKTSHELVLVPPMSIEEAQLKAPFAIKQPTIPFKVTEESAKTMETTNGFDAVEITYRNADEDITLVMMINNSKIDAPPNGQKGPKLANGAETWDQGDQKVSAIFWRHENLNYTLISGKISAGKVEPLYDIQKLVEIADTLK